MLDFYFVLFSVYICVILIAGLFDEILGVLNSLYYEFKSLRPIKGKWYQAYLKKGQDPVYPNYEGWSKNWYTLEEALRFYGLKRKTFVIRRVPWYHIEWENIKHIWHSFQYFIWFSLGMLSMFLIGKI